MSDNEELSHIYMSCDPDAMHSYGVSAEEFEIFGKLVLDAVLENYQVIKKPPAGMN